MTNDILLSLKEDVLFTEFLYYCRWTHDGEKLYEGRISNGLMGVINFVKDLGKGLGLQLKELFLLLKQKEVFKFFSEFKWDWNHFQTMLKAGYDVYKKLASFIPELLTDLAEAGLKLSSKTSFGQWTKKHSAIVHNWLRKHPILLRVSGTVLSCFLVVVWLNMSFTGNFESDFDFSDVTSALTGKFTFLEFFSSRSGVQTLVLFATGLFGLSFKWFTTPVNIAVLLLTNLAKHFRLHLKKGRDKQSPEAIASQVF